MEKEKGEEEERGEEKKRRKKVEERKGGEEKMTKKEKDFGYLLEDFRLSIEIDRNSTLTHCHVAWRAYRSYLHQTRLMHICKAVISCGQHYHLSEHQQDLL